MCPSCADDVGQCTPSAECAPGWADEAAAVVAIYAVDVRMGALGLCTGEHAVILHCAGMLAVWPWQRCGAHSRPTSLPQCSFRLPMCQTIA